MNQKDLESEIAYLKLSSLGETCPLKIKFDSVLLKKQLTPYLHNWIPYNQSKPGYNRYGLSLFSLDGGTSGEIDLSSVSEYNKENQKDYDEFSFRTPTRYWREFSSLSEPLKKIEKNLGRSHLLKFDRGGFFPPHRDRGRAFRLIAFFFCIPDHFVFLLEDKKFFFMPERLYFLDTRKAHSLFSFQDNATILVLNVEYNRDSLNFVIENLVQE